MRFRLVSLLLVPLLFSPLFMSLLIVSDELARRRPRNVFAIFAYAAFYSLVFIVNRQTRAKRQSLKIKSPVFWSLGNGAMFGGIFGVQVSLPVFVFHIVKGWQRHALLFSFWETFQQMLPDMLLAFGFVVMTFVVIGAATGSVFGLCSDRVNGR